MCANAFWEGKGTECKETSNHVCTNHCKTLKFLKCSPLSAVLDTAEVQARQFAARWSPSDLRCSSILLRLFALIWSCSMESLIIWCPSEKVATSAAATHQLGHGESVSGWKWWKNARNNPQYDKDQKMQLQCSSCPQISWWFGKSFSTRIFHSVQTSIKKVEHLRTWLRIQCVAPAGWWDHRSQASKPPRSYRGCHWRTWRSDLARYGGRSSRSRQQRLRPRDAECNREDLTWEMGFKFLEPQHGWLNFLPTKGVGPVVLTWPRPPSPCHTKSAARTSLSLLLTSEPPDLVDMKWMKTGDVEKRHKETKSVPTPTTTPKLGTKKDWHRNMSRGTGAALAYGSVSQRSSLRLYHFGWKEVQSRVARIGHYSSSHLCTWPTHFQK